MHLKKPKSNIQDKIAGYFSDHDIGSDVRILCAVSGGVDSVVMLQALIKEGYKCAVAHCNFKLRGAESDGDEWFVKSLSENLKAEYHVISFKTTEYATENGLSIQMAARELRYNWFNELIEKHFYDYIAIAHHSDDSIETVLINMARGTGINGITGIPEISGNIIRPLIKLRRHEIAAYAKKNKLKFRTDSSNNETKYHRNLIRHRIIPLFEHINPSFSETMLQNIDHFRGSSLLLTNATRDLLNQSVLKNDGEIIIETDKITPEAIQNGAFFSLLRRLKVSSHAANEVIKMLSGQAGKMVLDGNIQILNDRNKLIIREQTIRSETIFYVDKETMFISEPVVLQMKVTHKNHLGAIPDDNRTACLDIEKLSFPLTIRKWKKGDRFIPLGMNGFKKLSDFFVDQKLSRFDKEEVFLLCSGSEIVWIIGMRIDDRFKITKQTKQIYIISL